MSNIDFSRLISPRDRTAEVAEARRQAIKAECRRRILAQFPMEAQQNLALATTLFALAALQGGAVGAGPVAGLSEADIAVAAQGRAWITAMQAACRALSQAPEADPLADDAWPALPEEVQRLIARY